MKNRKRKVLLGVLIVLVLCVGIIIKNKTNTLSNGSINKESITKELDNNLIGAYIQEGEEYIQTDDIPSSGYEFNEEKSYCKIGEDIQEGTTLSYDMDTQTLTVSPITKEGMKCYLYFDEKASGSEYILASENAPTSSTTDWTGGISYYYTGNPNNWVQFGGFYWRIIRINGDGSIRMIYQGTSANETGEGTQIGYSAFNDSYDNNMYVGYMYTSGQVHGSGTSSDIKRVLDEWYSNNLATNYGQYIDGNAGFCGDRTPYTNTSGTTSGGGTGTTSTYYGGYIRLITNNNPSLQCDSQDIYTTSGSSIGNGALTNPIGLLIADEFSLSGGSDSYLYTELVYWTITPYRFNRTVVHHGAFVFTVMYSSLDNSRLDYGYGVRPVINLRADVKLSGSGTSTDPFKVVGAS